MREFRFKFAALARAARKAKGLTQEELAEAAGCSVESISNLERGKSAVSIELAADIIVALEIDPARLLSGRGKTTRKASARRRADEAALWALVDGLDDKQLQLLVQLAQSVQQVITKDRRGRE